MPPPLPPHLPPPPPPPPPLPPTTGPLATRWWIVAVYSLVAAVQGFQWTIPTVIASEMEGVYGVDGDTLQLLLAYGPICFIVFAVPFSWHMDRYGCRASVVAAAACVAASAALRCAAHDASTASLVLLHASFILNAVAGPVAMAAVGKLSEAWFPPHQRTTATALMAEANLFGGTIVYPAATYIVTASSAGQMLHLNLLVAVASGLGLLAAVAHFPSHPPAPPSASAAVQKAGESAVSPRLLAAALRKLATDTNFLILALGYGAVNGMASVFGAMLMPNLTALGVSQTAGGWLGFGSSLVGNLGGIALARLTDRLHNQRAVQVVLLTTAALFLALFAVVCGGLIPHGFNMTPGGYAVMFLATTIGTAACDSGVPLFFELAMEVTYPLPEGLVLTILTVLNNMAALVALFIPMDEAGTSWINWAYAGVNAAVAVVLLTAYRDSSPRYDYDMAALEGAKPAPTLSDSGETPPDRVPLLLAQ